MSDLFEESHFEESLFPEDAISFAMESFPSSSSVIHPVPNTFNADYEEISKTHFIPRDFIPEKSFISPVRDFLQEDFEGTEFATSPSASEIQGKWENDLEHLIRDFDSQNLPITKQVTEELIHTSVSKFHGRCKSLSLDSRTIEFLKSERKKLKNRQAAIRSRAKKEERVTQLERMVHDLLKENAALKNRLQAFESSHRD